MPTLIFILAVVLIVLGMAVFVAGVVRWLLGNIGLLILGIGFFLCSGEVLLAFVLEFVINRSNKRDPERPPHIATRRVTQRWLLSLLPELAQVPQEQRWAVCVRARARLNRGWRSTAGGAMWLSVALVLTVGWFLLADQMAWQAVWELLGDKYPPRWMAAIIMLPLACSGIFVATWFERRITRVAIIEELQTMQEMHGPIDE